MSSADCAKKLCERPCEWSYQGAYKRLYVAIPDASLLKATRVRSVFKLFVAALGAASLGACAQSGAGRNSEFASHSWRTPQHEHTASFFTHRHFASIRKHTPFPRSHEASPTHTASQGIASFYTEDQETASGEKFNTNELTAAHPTLPFGTKLKVTNVTTGKSVTVRVNDRGPYVPGRVVDVSHAAASELGMVGSGLAKVKLDVVQ